MKQLLLKLDFMRRIAQGESRYARGLSAMRVVVTGSDGFIGAQSARRDCASWVIQDLTGITRASTAAEFGEALADADIVFHLAGVNRPREDAEFVDGNVDLTARLCSELAAGGPPHADRVRLFDAGRAR